MNTPTFITPEKAVGSLREDEKIFGRLYLASCSGAEEFVKGTLAEYNALLAEKGAKEKEALLPIGFKRFDEGEGRPRISNQYPIRGADVYLFQQFPAGSSLDENLMEFLLTIRGLKECEAGKVTAILPCLPYSRQDKPTTFEREPISARLVADMIETAGADRILTWDTHAEQTRGFYRKHFLQMRPYAATAEQFKKMAKKPDVIVAGVDAGDERRALKVAKLLGVRYTTAGKERTDEGLEDNGMSVPAGIKRAIVTDDLMATGGTYANACENLQRAGVEEIYGWVSHLVCPESEKTLKNLERMRAAGLRKLYVTDTVPFENRAPGLIEVVRLEETFAQVINRLHYDDSTSSLFRGGSISPA